MITADSDAFARAYDQAALRVHHDLQNDPWLTIDALVAFAESHPEDLVEHNLGGVDVALPSGDAPRLGRSGAEVLTDIAENGSWMVLKNVERHPTYRAMLDRLLDGIEPLVPADEGTRLRREAFVFVSAPGSITPAHTDPEHNFLLQIRGGKTMHVGPFDDEASRTAALERYYAGNHRNIAQVPSGLRPFELLPGQGVYVPPDQPHWVQNGDEVSISLSVTWRTPTTERRSRLWAFNHQLRERGKRPRTPGESRVHDNVTLARSRASALRDRLLIPS
jgi:hypothetical protein